MVSMPLLVQQLERHDIIWNWLVGVEWFKGNVAGELLGG